MAKEFTIKIFIAPFADPFAPPTPNAPVTLQNRSPLAFEVSPNTQRITFVQPSGTDPGQTYVPGSITVKAPADGKGRRLKLKFSVVERQPPLPAPQLPSGAPYFEVGLVFSQLSSKVPDKFGRGGFPDFNVDDDGLVVTDTLAFESDYEFVLLIQNNYGGMALVDPRIINQT